MRTPAHALPLALVFAASLAPACGSQAEHGGFLAPDGGQSSSSGASPEGSSGGGSGSGEGSGGSLVGDGGGTVSSATYMPPTHIGCSTRAQQIVAFDFRSGWWVGGGGGDFAATALPIVTGTCPDTTIDYHHFETSMHVKCDYGSGTSNACQVLPAAVTVSDILSTLQLSAVSDYTQIWVLSGSSQDKSDIPVGDQLFQGVLGATSGACIPMLIAAGDGFVTHGNYLAQDLGMGTLLTEETSPPGFFSVQALPAHADTYLTGSELSSHVLFTGVTEIVDTVAQTFGNANVQQSKSDALAESVPSPTVYQVIAHDGAGNATIAVGATLGGSAPRPFIFDSGWQRTYALGQDPGTEQYVKNIVMYLSLVGCKAAPLAQ